MSGESASDEALRGGRELRSEFLRGQMREWLERVTVEGKTAELFELEMWLRSFERFFRIRNQPLSEREVKQLEGLLPICVFCKKIRDDKDEWQPIEGYIAQRSEADFTHGICPDCLAKFEADPGYEVPEDRQH